MPTVLRIRGYRFYFTPWKHEPPHVSRKGRGPPNSDQTFSAWRMKPDRRIREVLRLAPPSPRSLLAAWHEFETSKS